MATFEKLSRVTLHVHKTKVPLASPSKLGNLITDSMAWTFVRFSVAQRTNFQTLQGYTYLYNYKSMAHKLSIHTTLEPGLLTPVAANAKSAVHFPGAVKNAGLFASDPKITILVKLSKLYLAVQSLLLFSVFHFLSFTHSRKVSDLLISMSLLVEW